MRSRGMLTSMAAVAICALALAGCGGSVTTDADSGEPATRTPSTPP